MPSVSPVGSFRLYPQAQQGSSSSIAIIHMGDGTTIKAKVLNYLGDPRCPMVLVLVNDIGLLEMLLQALIGCDGVNSGRWAARGLSVFPQGLNYEFQQFMIADKKAGFVPLNDKELYWFLFCKFTPKG